MRLGVNIGYSGSALGIDLALIQEADRLGFHSVWSAEAYGSDAVSTIAWVAAQTTRIGVGTAIMQIPARTPTLAATTALTLDQLSGGRFLLGLGVSGPQVVEGWHGVAFGKPLVKTREYVEIVRAVWRREKPLEFAGAYYQIPYTGRDATGLGKPLKSILHATREIPISGHEQPTREFPIHPIAVHQVLRGHRHDRIRMRQPDVLRARDIENRNAIAQDTPACSHAL